MNKANWFIPIELDRFKDLFINESTYGFNKFRYRLLSLLGLKSYALKLMFRKDLPSNKKFLILRMEGVYEKL